MFRKEPEDWTMLQHILWLPIAWIIYITIFIWGPFVLLYNIVKFFKDDR